jgi:hypothetical protein
MKRRVTKLARQMRRLEYTIEIKPVAVATAGIELPVWMFSRVDVAGSGSVSGLPNS